jgi:Luciferase-like monooxygenase
MDKERSGERMKLGAFFHPTGNHVAAWLHPDAQIDAGTNFRHYAEITQTAERGKFDLMFVADAVATRDGKLEALSRWPQYMAYFDPLTLLPALAAVTTHVGLCATATTSYNEPYHIARKFGRHTSLAEHGNGPMVAGLARPPRCPGSHTSHRSQDRPSASRWRVRPAAATWRRVRISGGPLLGSAQSFLDALSTSSANRSHRAITSERYCLSLGVVASAWSLRARAAASR